MNRDCNLKGLLQNHKAGGLVRDRFKKIYIYFVKLWKASPEPQKTQLSGAQHDECPVKVENFDPEGYNHRSIFRSFVKDMQEQNTEAVRLVS